MNGAPTPDLAGYAAAMDRKRELLGRAVAFLGPDVPTWPADTQLDDDGKPFDPFLDPTSSTQTQDTRKVGVIFRQRGTEGAESSAIGWVESAHVCLVASTVDRAVIEAAETFEIGPDGYKIVAVHDDDPLPGYTRLLVYGRQR